MNEFKELIFWYLKCKRNLPWREIRDPYRLWVSEIILQQTRVETGTEYYLRFVNTYPDVLSLARADEHDVLKLWQGLGYYSRARNLLSTARYIAEHLGGVFPDSYVGLIKLKGVGPYTAAAIASFAYRLPHAAVDGNVARVLSRVFDIDRPVNTSEGGKIIARLAEEVLDRERPDLHNQAMMELGATVCTPRRPLCDECPLRLGCRSRQNGTVLQRPVKTSRSKPVVRHMDYAVLHTEDKLIFRRRREEDIWKGLHDFAALEGYDNPDSDRLLSFVAETFPGASIDKAPLAPRMAITHMLSHRRLETRFWEFELSGIVPEDSVYLSVDKTDVKSVAVPRPIERYLKAAKWV